VAEELGEVGLAPRGRVQTLKCLTRACRGHRKGRGVCPGVSVGKGISESRSCAKTGFTGGGRVRVTDASDCVGHDAGGCVSMIYKSFGEDRRACGTIKNLGATGRAKEAKFL